MLENVDFEPWRNVDDLLEMDRNFGELGAALAGNPDAPRRCAGAPHGNQPPAGAPHGALGCRRRPPGAACLRRRRARAGALPPDSAESFRAWGRATPPRQPQDDAAPCAVRVGLRCRGGRARRSRQPPVAGAPPKPPDRLYLVSDILLSSSRRTPSTDSWASTAWATSATPRRRRP